MAKVLDYLAREPVRAYLRTALASAVALLVGYDVVTQDTAALWAALGTAVIGFPTVEVVRARVTPYRTQRVEGQD